MREFLLSNGPLIAGILAAGELLFGILLISLYEGQWASLVTTRHLQLTRCIDARDQDIPRGVGIGAPGARETPGGAHGAGRKARRARHPSNEYSGLISFRID